MKHLLLFIRHGESTWNVEHRLPGQLPGIELTEAGRAQAQRLARALSMLPLSSIISSPLARAVETASLHCKPSSHLLCLAFAGIPSLDGYNSISLHPSKAKVKGTQLESRTHREQTFHNARYLRKMTV